MFSEKHKEIFVMNNYKTITIKINEKEIEVKVSLIDSSIWLDASQITKLFERSRTTIIHHINSILSNDFEHVEHVEIFDKLVVEGNREVNRKINYYHLSLIKKIGYRIKSNKAEELEKLVNEKLKESFTKDNEIIIYDNGSIKIDVNVSPKEETVWLSVSQISTLYGTSTNNIYLHIKSIFADGEMANSVSKDYLPTEPVSEDSSVTEPVSKDLLYTGPDGKRYMTTFYNLDMILAIGYRVKSKKAIEFRKWVTSVLKQYLIKGYAIDRDRVSITAENILRLQSEVNLIKEDIQELRKKSIIESIKEKDFFAGEYFDAYEYISSIIAEANNSVAIIDPYFDTKGLMLLSKAKKDVKKSVFISSHSSLTSNDIDNFVKQYGEIRIVKRNDIHDRFIVIDETIFYLVGTSLNYLGSKFFVVVQISEPKLKSDILGMIKN